MKRWHGVKGDHIENAKVDAFLAEIWNVCEKHGMSIAHEDGHGAFLIQSLDDENRRWLFDAHDETDV